MNVLRKVLVGIWVIITATAMGSAMPGNGADTVMATVVYGDSKLLDGKLALTDEAIDDLLDSLCTLDPAPQDLIRDLMLFQRIRKMDQLQMMGLIDSLFELVDVPYALISEINLYATNMPDQAEVDRSSTIEWELHSEHPHEDLYGPWNMLDATLYHKGTASRADSVLQLRLVDESLAADHAIPVPGVVTSRFGWRNGRPHNGIDLDLEVMDLVVSAFPGVVRFAATWGGFGRLVVVRHYNGLETYYAHLHRIGVKPGQRVEAGQMLGYGGSSGHSTGSHLHFEVRFMGVPIDPSKVFDFGDRALVSETLVLKRARWGYAAYPKGAQFHTVQKGEHLYAIAERYGLSITSLCQLNGISRQQPLAVGQRLVVAGN
jgi:murein DD-endopeptidase MepM/ murein hydrolase activator NlpD